MDPIIREVFLLQILKEFLTIPEVINLFFEGCHFHIASDGLSILVGDPVFILTLNKVTSSKRVTGTATCQARFVNLFSISFLSPISPSRMRTVSGTGERLLSR